MILLWTLFVLVTPVMAVLIAPLGDVAEQVTYLVSSAIASVSLTVTIFYRYAYYEYFPISAVMNIGVTFALSFFQIGLASADVAFTKLKKAQLAAGKEVDQSLKVPIDILWFMVYFGTILTGSILMTFYQIYWQSGHFSIRGKIKFTVKKIKLYLLYSVIVFGLATGVLIMVSSGD